MALNKAFRVGWNYNDGSGNRLQGFAEQSVDVIATPLADGSADPAALAAVIGNNFPTPAGATLSITSISTSASPVVYS